MYRQTAVVHSSVEKADGNANKLTREKGDGK